MNATQAVVIDDDPHIRSLVRVNLEGRGYRVREAGDGRTAMALIERNLPDLVVLDLVLPGGPGGNDVCVWLREWSDIPIIVMSASHEEDLKVKALDAGADDYVTKPFGQAELMARIRAVMRRVGGPTPLPPREEQIRVSDLTINLKARRAYIGGAEVRLTRTEFALLAELARNANAVLTHDELLARVWGEEYRGSSHYLHVYFGRIRKKIGEHHSGLLESIPGVGYILHATAPR